MGMLFDLRQVTDEEMTSLLRDPADIFFFLHGTEPYEPPRGLFKRLFGGNKTKVKRCWHAPASDMFMALDKHWHILHYVLCREPWDGPLPQATLLSGGVSLGDVDVGYGPARLLNPDEVQQFSNYLNALTREQFASGITTDELASNEVYGACFEWNEEEKNAIWNHVEEMRLFFNNAQFRKNGVILYLY